MWGQTSEKRNFLGGIDFGLEHTASITEGLLESIYFTVLEKVIFNPFHNTIYSF